MNPSLDQKPFIAIACGGTGGHLFPGVAVAEQLLRLGAAVTLLISPKEVDQQAVKNLAGVEVFTLPAVGLQNRNYLSFARSFWSSFRLARKLFRNRRPQAVLAMGGFTSAPPILAAKLAGAKTFLHESNSIPGRANRFLGRFVDEAFVGFSGAATRLSVHKIITTGTPVRPQIQVREHPGGNDLNEADSAACRLALGLEPKRPTVLVVGGSQGATGLNDLILAALPRLANRNWQWVHLTGARDAERVKAFYAAQGIAAIVKPFLVEMNLALGAATACVSRAGASSLAELAACRVPALLVPFPAAADNHQFFNAAAFAASGAAKMVEQSQAAPEIVAAALIDLVENNGARSNMRAALIPWHAPEAAAQIAENIVRALAPMENQLAPPSGRPRVPDPVRVAL
jgi:UDP-N-acetylglucosamine--N-acetylmuramyl-(pentapeptide) pyrophosphoryl-undecaprenol N-acetylglucosamine transferase